MIKRTPLLVFTLSSLSALGLLACGGGATSGTNPPGVSMDQSNAPRDPASPAALSAAVTANNAFAFKLYGALGSDAATGGNVLTSPLSASLALTMTYAGAQGQTQSEMASALKIDPSAGSIFDGQNALSQALAGRAAAALAYDTQLAQEGGGGAAPAASDYAVQVVNSVWGENNYPWASPFLDVLAKSYGTGIYLEDFVTNATGVRTTINDWVSTETAGKIENFIPPGAIDADTRMVLVNAVHLKLPWNIAFDPSRTAPGAFTRGDGSTVNPSFMHAEITTGYLETPDAQVVTLPLSHNQLSVVIALPKNGLGSLVASLTPASWATLNNVQEADVILSLPKFTFTSSTFSLVQPLQALGMKTAFDPKAADFKGLCATTPDQKNLYIGDVLQKAMMAVAETGVEAAAATAVVLAGTAAETTPPPTVTMTIDQPFLISIVDSSGAIVFLGEINDPTNTGSP